LFTYDVIFILNKTILLCPLFLKYSTGFEVLTVVSTNMAVFWVVAPCNLVRAPDDGGSKDL
jgi:hypothetical protein